MTFWKSVRIFLGIVLDMILFGKDMNKCNIFVKEINMWDIFGMDMNK